MKFITKIITAIATGLKRLIMFYVLLWGIVILAGMWGTIPSQVDSVFSDLSRQTAMAEILSTQETCILVEPRDVTTSGQSNVAFVPCQDLAAELAKRPAKTKQAGRKREATIAFETVDGGRVETKKSFAQIRAHARLKAGDRIQVSYDRAQPETSVGPVVQDQALLRHAILATMIIAAVLYIGMRVRRTMYWAATGLLSTVLKPQSTDPTPHPLRGAIAKAGPWATRIADVFEPRAQPKAASTKPAPMPDDRYRSASVRKPASPARRTPTVRRASSWGLGR